MKGRNEPGGSRFDSKVHEVYPAELMRTIQINFFDQI
jgi:hypothetical protein